MSTKNDLKDFPKAVKDDDVLGTLPTLDKYIPAVMQALFYYTEMLQYEQLHTTTVEPPFGQTLIDNGEVNTPGYKPTTTTRKTTTTTTQRPTTTTKYTTKAPSAGVESTTPTFLYSTILDLWCKIQTKSFVN